MIKSSSQTERIFGADLIRAVAITSVMLSHTLPGASTFAAVRAARGLFGYFGVEIFFVLSGYLIGAILLRSLFNDRLSSLPDLVVFWKRRWFRTLPNYYLFLLLNLGAARWSDGNWPASGWNFFWFGQGLLTEHPKFFTVAWSLAVEEWFYLTFPLLLWMTLKAFRNREIAFWLSVAVFLFVPLAFRGWMTGRDWDDGLRKVAVLRLDAIMFGVILAYLRERRPARWHSLCSAWPLGIMGTAGLMIYLMAGHEMTVGSTFDRVFFFSATSLSLALLFPFVLMLKPPGENITTQVHRLSLWSYSMYLSHAWLGQLLHSLFQVAGWSLHGVNAVVLSLLDWIATLTVSAWLYSRYEKPLMELRERSVKSMLSSR